jgi:hypothetical protein
MDTKGDNSPGIDDPVEYMGETRLTFCRQGREAIIWHLNGVVQSYSTNSTEEFVREMAEEQGLNWNEPINV